MLEYLYIVDDDPLCRELLRQAAVGTNDRIVQCFSSGDEFLNDWCERDPGVILLDMTMPGASGLEVLAQIVQPPERFIIIIQSALGELSVAVEAMQVGAQNYLQKPISEKTFNDAIENAFSALHLKLGEQAASEDAARGLTMLSPRERDVLTLVSKGHCNKSAAAELGLSRRTIETHRANVCAKLGVRTIAQAVHLAAQAPAFRKQVAETTDHAF